MRLQQRCKSVQRCSQGFSDVAGCSQQTLGEDQERHRCLRWSSARLAALVTIREERMRAMKRKKKEEKGKMALLEAFRVRILFYALILCKQINPKSIVRLLEKRDVIEYKVYMGKTQTQFFFFLLSLRT